MVKQKQKLPNVPKNIEELNKFVFELGAEAREIEKAGIRLQEEVAVITQNTAVSIAPRQKRAMELLEGIYVYAQANRATLTDENRRKTIELANGVIQWRMSPFAVVLGKKVKEEDVIASIDALGFSQFIREKRELNKEAMLEDKDKAREIAGVSIDQHEDFVVKPSDMTREIVRGKAKKRKL